MQALGSAITYARRYSLLAIYGLAGDDDDAEGSAPVATPAKKEIARSPARGANARQAKPSSVAHEMVTGKVADTPKFTQSQSNQVQKFMSAHPDGWEGIVKAFNDEFNKTGDKISQSITNQEQMNFILERITGYENLSR